MSASPKSKRTPDERRMLEDYVLVKEMGVGSGLFPVSHNKMQDFTFGTEFNPGVGPSSQGMSGIGEATIPIGFKFRFDGLDYTQIHVTVSGMVVLLQQSRSIFTSGTDYLAFSTSTDQTDNNALKDVLWQYDDVVLAPWWDALKNVWRTTNGYVLGFLNSAAAYITALGDDVTQVDRGEVPCPAGIDSRYGGVKYFRGNDSRGTKVLVVRWKSFTGILPANQGIIVHFDLVLYENGVIEFRYDPLILDRYVDDLGDATIGIFASGPSFYANRYRDASPILGRQDSRGTYVNGGAVYNGSFVEPVSSTKYSSTLRSYYRTSSTEPNSAYTNWPASENFGATLRFSPPALKYRQNRSITTLRDATSFVNEDTQFFSDQKTFPFVTQEVEYPSMVPTANKVTNATPGAEGSLSLYANNSIRVVREGTYPGLFDEVLRDAVIEERWRRGK